MMVAFAEFFRSCDHHRRFEGENHVFVKNDAVGFYTPQSAYIQWRDAADLISNIRPRSKLFQKPKVLPSTDTGSFFYLASLEDGTDRRELTKDDVEEDWGATTWSRVIREEGESETHWSIGKARHRTEPIGRMIVLMDDGKTTAASSIALYQFVFLKDLNSNVSSPKSQLDTAGIVECLVGFGCISQPTQPMTPRMSSSALRRTRSRSTIPSIPHSARSSARRRYPSRAPVTPAVSVAKPSRKRPAPSRTPRTSSNAASPRRKRPAPSKTPSAVSRLPILEPRGTQEAKNNPGETEIQTTVENMQQSGSKPTSVTQQRMKIPEELANLRIKNNQTTPSSQRTPLAVKQEPTPPVNENIDVLNNPADVAKNVNQNGSDSSSVTQQRMTAPGERANKDDRLRIKNNKKRPRSQGTPNRLIVKQEPTSPVKENMAVVKILADVAKNVNQNESDSSSVTQQRMINPGEYKHKSSRIENNQRTPSSPKTPKLLAVKHEPTSPVNENMDVLNNSADVSFNESAQPPSTSLNPPSVAKALNANPKMIRNISLTRSVVSSPMISRFDDVMNPVPLDSTKNCTNYSTNKELSTAQKIDQMKEDREPRLVKGFDDGDNSEAFRSAVSIYFEVCDLVAEKESHILTNITRKIKAEPGSVREREEAPAQQVAPQEPIANPSDGETENIQEQQILPTQPIPVRNIKQEPGLNVETENVPHHQEDYDQGGNESVGNPASRALPNQDVDQKPINLMAANAAVPEANLKEPITTANPLSNAFKDLKSALLALENAHEKSVTQKVKQTRMKTIIQTREGRTELDTIRKKMTQKQIKQEPNDDQ